MQRTFATEYEGIMDIIDYAVYDLRSIAHLIECNSHFMATVGTNKEVDMSATYFLSNLINDIADSIDKTLTKEIENKTRN